MLQEVGFGRQEKVQRPLATASRWLLYLFHQEQVLRHRLRHVRDHPGTQPGRREVHDRMYVPVRRRSLDQRRFLLGRRLLRGLDPRGAEEPHGEAKQLLQPHGHLGFQPLQLRLHGADRAVQLLWDLEFPRPREGGETSDDRRLVGRSSVLCASQGHGQRDLL